VEQQALVLEKLDQHSVLAALSRHIGKGAGVKIGSLVFEATGSAPTASLERQCRNVISDLRRAGYPVCAHPRNGYYVAKTQQELDECCQFLRDRAMHSLTLEAALRRVALPELIGQLRFVEH